MGNKFKLKEIFFPKKEEQRLEAYELWEVRWDSRHGNYSGDTEPVMEVFTNKEDAIKFKKSLEEAFKLVRNTSENYVELKKGHIR